MPNALNVVAVTACVSGVAHTYMAAEQLEKQCKKRNYRIKVETQGALGIENRLEPEVIDNADVALIVSDINIEGDERFKACRLVKLTIHELLTHPEKVMAAIDKARHMPRSTVMALK